MDEFNLINLLALEAHPAVGLREEPPACPGGLAVCSTTPCAAITTSWALLCLLLLLIVPIHTQET